MNEIKNEWMNGWINNWLNEYQISVSEWLNEANSITFAIFERTFELELGGKFFLYKQ